MNLFVLLTLLTAVGRAHPVVAKMPDTLDLAQMLARAPIVVLATVEDPRLTVVERPLPVPAGKPPQVWQAAQRHYRMLLPYRGLTPGVLTVADHAAKAKEEAALRCAAEGQPVDACMPKTPRYLGSLSREPVPGSQVLLFLTPRTDGGFELAAEQAIDAGERREEVRAWLDAHPESTKPAVRRAPKSKARVRKGHR